MITARCDTCGHITPTHKLPISLEDQLYWLNKSKNHMLMCPECGSKNITVTVKGIKIGRNQPCPCNSGKKYKKCCGV